MTEPANRYGLPRTIPADVKREVRVRSKFGCVICRKGFFTYEHIDPLFRDAKKHDPDNICCLCWGCQDAVTRKHISKDTVMQAYKRIHAAALEDVAPPFGPLDFNDGNAELRIGSSWHQGTSCNPSPTASNPRYDANIPAYALDLANLQWRTLRQLHQLRQAEHSPPRIADEARRKVNQQLVRDACL